MRKYDENKAGGGLEPMTLKELRNNNANQLAKGDHKRKNTALNNSPGNRLGNAAQRGSYVSDGESFQLFDQ